MVRGQAPEAQRYFALSQPEESANLSRNLFLQNKEKFVGRLGAMAPGSLDPPLRHDTTNKLFADSLRYSNDTFLLLNI